MTHMHSIFMMTWFFKKEIRHQFKFFRVMGYVPNLKYGKGTNNRQSTGLSVKSAR